MGMMILAMIGGLAILVVGAEIMVRGASRLAASVGVPPLIIGLTIVAFGTSSPELAVSLQSSISGQPEIALGNIIGSNILNVLLILGASALITPLLVAQQLVRLDVPIMIGASILVWVLALNGTLGRVEGAALFACMLLYLAFLIWQSRRERNEAVKAEYAVEYAERVPRSASRSALHVVLIVVGLTMLVLGSQFFVDGASNLARFFGLSELVIGLTIVAVGTSMPEIAASLLAAFKGERDIAVGNVVGSNIFNLLSVLGLAAFGAPDGIPVSQAVLSVDLPFMVAVAVACLPIFLTGNVIARWEGAVFLGYYVAYTTYLLLDAASHPRTMQYRDFMLLFVMPLTVITLGIALGRELHSRRNDHSSSRPSTQS